MHRLRSVLILASVLFALIVSSESSFAQRAPAKRLPLKRRATPTTAAITAKDLMSRLYVFADDSMQGREAGSEGHMKATTYIAKQLERLHMEPAGDSGTYFQTLPLISRTFLKSSTITIGSGMYNAFADFVALPFRGAAPRKIDHTQAVYGGVWGDTSNQISASQAQGRLVVLQAPNGFTRIPPNSALSSAAAVAVVGGEMMTAAQMAQGRTPSYALPASPNASPTPVVLIVTPFMAQHLFGAPLESLTVATIGTTITGELEYDEKPAPTRNVIGIIRGSDSLLANEYVALGAHSDHLGYRIAGPLDHDSLHAFGAQRFRIMDNPSGAPLTPEARAERDARIAAIHVNADSMHRRRPARRDSIFNGADDDGSGTVTLLEVAEAFARAKTRPRRSLLFVWHTAEEKGLLGSRWYGDHPTVPLDSIVAQINLDMVGRGAAQDLPGGSERYLQVVGSRRLSTELGDLLETVNRSSREPFTLDYAYDANGHPENIYCRSDHYNYARFGIPVVFLTTGLHGDYHQVTDEPQYIDYPKMARIGQLTYTLAGRVAALDHRPVVDKPRPDPLGSCRQ